MKENIWIIVIGIAAVVYSLYKRSKKAIQTEPNPKSADIFDTILSGLEEIEESKNPIVQKKNIYIDKANEEKLQKIEKEENIGQLKEMDVEELFPIQRSFDLKDAIIYSAILQRRG